MVGYRNGKSFRSFVLLIVAGSPMVGYRNRA